MARRWSVKKDAQTTTLDKETRMSYALKNREEQGRIVSPEARSFHVSSLHVLYPSRPTRAIFIMAHPLRQSTPRGASYDTHRRFQQLPWLATKTLVEGNRPLGNRHLDEAGTEDQGD